MTESEPMRPGQVLRDKREALDVTVREVSETLNLSMTVIEAIEADDLGRLPGPVFARGYVRAYARLLELDPRPLLERYPKPAFDVVPPPEASTEPPIWEWIRRRPGLVLGVAGGVLLALLMLVVSLLWPDGTEQPSVAPGAEAPPAESTPDPGPAPQDVLDPATAVTLEPGAAEPDPGPGGDVREEVTPAPDFAVAEAPDADVPGQAAGEAAGASRITAHGEDLLHFSFTDDCWVEVKSATGANLYSDLNRAGTELRLLGQGPFRILLGYAPGATLTFNGEPVSLAPHTRNNVATLVLGQ